MNEFWYRIRRGAMYTASLLPFKVLYAISDLIYFIAYHIILLQLGMDFLNAVVVQPRKALRTALPPHAQPVLQPSFP